MTTATTLLLLHGLAGNGRLWDGAVPRWTAGPVVAPDLAGHGTAPRLARYGFDDYATELAARLGDLGGATDIVVIGHSLGGLVALRLAALRPDLPIGRIVSLGCKTTWTEADVTGLHRVADKGVSWFDDETAARERFVAVGGLRGVLDPASEAAGHGVVADGGRWRLAADPEVYRVAAADFGAALAAVSCPVVVARGEHDVMAPTEDLAAFGRGCVTLAGLGHNAHVEDPTAVLALLDA